jgi:hypothetical protein
MAKPAQHATGHGDHDSNGKGHHDSTHADAKATPGQIGQPFTPMMFNPMVANPMVANAPVSKFSTPDVKLPCASCGAQTWHTPYRAVPPCAHCGAPLSAA